jgi:Superinfection immunity protein
MFFLACVFAFVLHFLPAFLAFSRNHPSRWAILLVNIFFGWTILGWIIALIWALSAPPIVIVHYPPPGGPPRW